MIAELKPYPTMKDSGVEWLGEVPEHWEVRPNRAFFEEVKDRGHSDEPLLSVTITQGIIPQETLLADGSKKDSSNLDRSNYKLVRPGDIAYNKMRAWQGAFGVSRYRGLVSPAYVVQRPRTGVEPRYVHYLLRTPAFAKEAERWSYGITSDMWSLRPEHFRLIYSCCPPAAEQTAIVRFLDYADRRIRRYIRAKQKLIKLLEEQKHAIIHRAVTRGLDPDVPLKDSGVEGMGEVPEHWEVVRASAVADFMAGKAHEPVIDPEGEFICVTARFVSTGGQAKRRCLVNNCPAMRGDVLMVMSDLPRGRALARAYWTERDDKYAVNQRVCILRPRAIHSRFLAYVADRNPQLLAYDDGFNQTHLPNRAFKTMKLPLPPGEEQTAIALHLDQEIGTRRRAAERARQEVELLRELRTRLNADVVTGKLDVRDVAARLPDGEDSVDEAEDLDEDEATLEDSDLDAELEEIEA